MRVLQAAFVAIFLFMGFIDAYELYEPSLLESLRMYQDSLRNKRKSPSVAEQVYYQDLLAPFFSRRHTHLKRSEILDGRGGCSERSKITYASPNTAHLDVRFPSVHTTKDDMYMCTGYKVPFEGEESFIVKFTPHADMDRTHHMLVYGCPKLDSNKPSWECADPCPNKKTLYAWARNAPEMTLPKDVGFSIGRNSGINYIAVQMHFAKAFEEGSCAGVSADITTVLQKNFAGIFLLGAYNINLPPHSYNVPSSAACMNTISDPLHVFAFRTHAHTHANVITGYRLREHTFKMIGKGNPKWPQSFYPRVGGEIVLQQGDILTAQCIYNNTEGRTINAGSTGSDEMCNLYLMFYTPNKNVLKTRLECWGLPPGVKEKDFTLPKSAKNLAPYPGYAGEDSNDAVAFDGVVVPSVPPEHIHNHHGGGDHDEESELLEEETEEAEGDPMEEEPKEQEMNVDAKLAELQNLLKENGTLSRSHGMPQYQGLKADLSYPHLQEGYSVGAVGGLVAAPDGSVYVFHRADREWTASSFDSHNRFTSPNSPIMKDTVYHLSRDTGYVLHSWGKNMFFMPHGASLDHEGNLWLTDVAMHQVFKFPQEGADEALITLGQRMVPGRDIHHFCKPTDVAIDSDGMVYVSDGYCNGRVMKFSPDGSFIMQWGRMVTSRDLMRPPIPPYAFFIAHNIILCGPDKSEVCVADRENGRIQCFTKNGQLTRIISDPQKTGTRVFAITYSPLEGGLIYGVSGPRDNGEGAGGFTIHYDTGVVMKRWQPSPDTKLLDPHDISASPTGQQAYVGDLTHKKVFKFSQVPSAQEDSPVEIMPGPHPPLESGKEQFNEKSQTEKDEEGHTELAQSSRNSVVDTSPLEDDKEEVNRKTAEDEGMREYVDIIPYQGENDEVMEVREFPDEDVSPSGVAVVVIICLVVLPTITVIIAMVCIRIRAKRLKEYESLLSSGKSGSKSLNLGKFLKPAERKGFQRVRSDGSDDDEDSDVEVYSKKVGDEEKSVQ